MPFFTRDFQQLFAVEFTTVQYMANKGYISISGPPPKGRGGRRRYDLNAAFRIGLTSRLRTFGVSLEQCQSRTHFVQRFFSDLSQLGTAGLSEFQRPYFAYNPFTQLHPDPRLDFFLEVYDNLAPGTGRGKKATAAQHYTWETILPIPRDEPTPNRPSAAFHVLEPTSAAALKQKTPPDAEQTLFADIRIRINLSKISRKLEAFVADHARQFPEYQ